MQSFNLFADDTKKYPVDLNIYTEFTYQNENLKKQKAHYVCKSLSDLKKEFEKIKTSIDCIEFAINKKLTSITIKVSGNMNGKQLDNTYTDFHKFAEFASPNPTKECGWGLRR